MATKHVYFFGSDASAGRADKKNLLRGKAANLAEMTSINVPVTTGYTISTDVCELYGGKAGDNTFKAKRIPINRSVGGGNSGGAAMMALVVKSLSVATIFIINGTNERLAGHL